MNFAIVGAGLSGSVLAHELAQAGHSITLLESRNHPGGNVYSQRDEASGIMLHVYGPHIFHTDSQEVWSYVNRLAEFIPFINRIKTTVRGRVYSLPINLHTINQFYHKAFSPQEARQFIASISHSAMETPGSFEEQALQWIGKDLYENFFKGYTLKQWGIHPRELPAAILKRLPLRFNYDDNYYFNTFQGIPKEGYTPIIEKLLDHPQIQLSLNTPFQYKQKDSFDHVFYTGPLDGWFDYAYGRLGYRTLDFVREDHIGDYQGCALMNYGDVEVPYTRITEHKHFTPWEKHENTVIHKEYSRFCQPEDIPYYPIRLVREKALLHTYVEKAREQTRVSFLGRLATYRYLDMDVTIGEALAASRQTLAALHSNQAIPVFFVDPL
ncbi:MAG: UDP-galactopyranose mutase [Magnetococcales bacterium]|nr:UDP-galactopyranose mutase [Magnetococcales bacterium]NGZ28877.1 UDP-galactopyranose mutase [Magnetococcales bacterium]